MPVQISKTVFIEVAHRLPSSPIAANSRVHGHSMAITATIAGDAIDFGMVQHFEILTAQLQTIAAQLDHQYLNESHPEIQPPTMENIAKWVGQLMGAAQPIHTRLVSVKVERRSLHETAEWFP